MIYNGQMQNTNKEQSQDMSIAFCNLVLLLQKYQNQLQATRQLLTLNPDFNPQSLFKYLTMGEQALTKGHIMYFLQVNTQPIRYEQAKMLFTVYGYKDKLNYSDFLNYVYPYDIQTVKTISKILCKKYIKHKDNPPTDQILCIFLMLLVKQFQFLHSFEDLKLQKFPQITRQSLKVLFKILKKYSIQTLSGINNDYLFTFTQFKSILKKLLHLPQSQLQPICRRFSLQKQSFIGLDQLEIWLKPWFKQKPQQSPHPIYPSQTLYEDISQTLIT